MVPPTRGPADCDFFGADMTVKIDVAVGFAVVSHIHHGDLVVLHNGRVWQVRPVGHAGTELGTRSLRVRAPLCNEDQGLYIRMLLAPPVTSGLEGKLKDWVLQVRRHHF